MLTHLFTTQVGAPPGMTSFYNDIVLIGAGGNGAPMLMRLHKMHTTLRALGRTGLKVTLWDMDTVSRFNIGRQPFYPADIGKNKAQLLIDRLKAIDPSVSDWVAEPRRFEASSNVPHSTLMVITCVDTKEARRNVHKSVFERQRALYWLDMGNEADTAQIVLGECRGQNRKLRLPVVTELYPEVMDESIPEDDAPSCSTEEAITKQGLFVNETVVAHAASMIWYGLYEGAITHPVEFINIRQQSTTAIGIDRAFYKRRGVMFGRAKNPRIVDI